MGGELVGDVCTWQRKLCVTCHVTDQKVFIRIQTNNLPDHCIKSSSVKPQEFDYQVLFDSDVDTDNLANDFTSQEQMNHEVCDLHKQWSDDLEIQELVANPAETESIRAMGFALNGVAFQFANQVDEDPVAPVNESNEQPLDICMGHNQLNSQSGMYHYHTVSPCINPMFLATGPRVGVTYTECQLHPSCWDDKTQWVQDGFSQTNWHKRVIGLSKDGRPIYGPLDASGVAWTSPSVDACNGVRGDSDDDHDYYYVGTAWHPYAVGCQGPSNYPYTETANPMFPNCSTNGIDQHLN